MLSTLRAALQTSLDLLNRAGVAGNFQAPIKHALDLPPVGLCITLSPCADKTFRVEFPSGHHIDINFTPMTGAYLERILRAQSAPREPKLLGSCAQPTQYQYDTTMIAKFNSRGERKFDMEDLMQELGQE